MSAKVEKPIAKGPMSEDILAKDKTGTPAQCLENLRAIATANPEKVITRNYFRVHGRYAESCWNGAFGTFNEFKRQAGIVLSRQQHAHERTIAKHASVDHYRKISLEREGYADTYRRDSKKRFKTVIVTSDLHDIEIDPFFLRVFLDTVKRVQPDDVVLAGDIFDLPEFGKYPVDPREWNAAGRIKFAHTKILGALRAVFPDGNIDLIEGNHEARLLRLLADATPALRAVLSDFLGMGVKDLFKLPELEINYIAKGDLSAYTERDLKQELQNNYKVYYGAFLAHHFPHARNMGMPGCNGHHHKHIVWPMFNPMFKAYEWHQLGAGHKRGASYCEGEKWHNGFLIENIDTHTKATAADYVTVGEDFAVSGGKFYYRTAAEQV
jgi:hypothetical protein